MSTRPKLELNCGGGFTGLLFIALLVMKLGGWADISWWWVFAPFWVPLAIVGFILVVVGFALLVCELVDRYEYYRRTHVK